VCNLSFGSSTIVSSAETTFTLVTSLAQITAHVGSSGTPQGRAINEFARSMEIGGMVFSYTLCPRDLGDALFVTDFDQNQFDHRVLVVSDAIDANGNPNSIPDWFVPGTPLVGVSDGSNTPLPTSQDNVYPTRIHFQDRLSSGYGIAGGTTGNPVFPLYDRRTGHKNLRLNLRLSDKQGLFFHFATKIFRPSAGDPTEFEHELRVTGTMYYRVRF